jgi:cobalt/nickel transport protein
MKTTSIFLILFVIVFFIVGNSYAHFGMVIPSDSMVMPEDNRTLTLKISFSHPFEKSGMDLVKPKRCAVFSNGKEMDLIGFLEQSEIMEHKAWLLEYKIIRPGVYSFYMEPKPYWEPAEDCFIIHYTKTIVAAFGAEDGWDEPLGLKTEIIPLTRPFGLYAGNVFQGIVKLDDKPAPYSEVEIEYFNYDGKAKAPTDYMVTQVVKADSKGVFTYSVPRAGWWGFAALNRSNEKIRHNGEEKDIELGAVIWVQFLDWSEN